MKKDSLGTSSRSHWGPAIAQRACIGYTGGAGGAHKQVWQKRASSGEWGTHGQQGFLWQNGEDCLDMVTESKRQQGWKTAGSGVSELPLQTLPLTSPAQDPHHTPEHRLHKHSQGLYVDPGNKGLAEVHLEPAQQRSLQRRENGMSFWTLRITAKKGLAVYRTRPATRGKGQEPAEAEKSLGRLGTTACRCLALGKLWGSHRHMREATLDQGWEARQLLTSRLTHELIGSCLALHSQEAHLIGRHYTQGPAHPSTSCTCQGLFKPHLGHSYCCRA